MPGPHIVESSCALSKALFISTTHVALASSDGIFASSAKTPASTSRQPGGPDIAGIYIDYSFPANRQQTRRHHA